MATLHRIFVGGLFDSITKDELKERFQSFGDVSDVTIIQKKDGEGSVTKTFGYVNLTTTTPKVNKCFAVYGGTTWKGHQLKVQLAKEDFMTKLQRERDEPPIVVKKKKKCNGPTKTYNDILKTTSTMKNVVPGTPVDGERNWVIGKYGRPLPIVYVPKVGGRKTVKVDPSKFCHCLKRIADDGDGDDVDVKTLTWSYDEDDKILQTKKKKKKRNEEKLNEECIEMEIKNGSTVLTDSVPTSEGSIDTTSEKKKKKSKRKKSMHNGDGEKEGEKEGENVDNVNGNERNSVLNPNCLELSEEFETVHPSHNQNKTKRRKDKEGECGTQLTTPADSISATSLSLTDSPLCKEKRKKRSNKVKDGEETIAPMTTTPIHTEEVIKQNSNSNHSELLALHVDDDKHKEKCIPEIPFLAECVHEEVENRETPLKKRLSTSIIEQLLSHKKLPLSSSENLEPVNHLRNTNQSDISVNTKNIDTGKNKDTTDTGISVDTDKNMDAGEIENMFDFEFKTIINKSFLSTLVNNIEVRDDINESDKDSDVESECSSSDSSVSDLECLEMKGPLLDVDNEKTGPLNENIGPGCMHDDLTVKDANDVDLKAIHEIDINKQLNESSDVKQMESIKAKKLKDINADGTKKLKISHINKQEKHALSEEKRTKSLNARNSQIVQNKDAVSKALKEVDKPMSGANRIVFNESDEEDVVAIEENVVAIEEDVVAIEENVVAIEENEEGKKLLWSDDEGEGLGDGNRSENRKQLFDDDDDDEDDDDEGMVNDEISLKPQFHGKGGEKLFKMQQKFGGDERFKLDERFVEGDDEIITKDSNEGDTVENNGAETVDLQKEKEMNISVLEQVLGKPISIEKKDGNYGQAYQRYDPDNIEHEKYEVKAKPAEEETETEIKTTKVIQQKLPEVSKETFYTVDESIKDLFAKGESTSFSFFGNESEDKIPENGVQDSCEVVVSENECEEETKEQMEIEAIKKTTEVKVKETSWKRGLEEIQKSEEAFKEAKELFIGENDIKTDEKEMQTYLFFQEGDKRLEIGKRFVRTEEIDEIINQWKAIRRNLTEDYKKKHKDAVRRVRKMREKRFSKR